MSVIICAYVWICIWHYAYLNFRVFYSFRVEGYAFECLRFCKFLLSQTLTAKKVALSFVFIVIHCAMMNFNGAWCGDMIFFCLCIPFKYAFMFPPILANFISLYELFIPLALASPLSSFVNFPWVLGYKSCVHSWCAMCILFVQSKVIQQSWMQWTMVRFVVFNHEFFLFLQVLWKVQFFSFL